MLFKKILRESKRIFQEKIWIDKGSESWLERTAIEMYSIHNEGKSVLPGRFIRILKNKIYKYVTPISKKYILID